ncbi:MAG: PACE efflux transporter [Rhizobium sp.]|nr:PACE efflux transporter [Rhizobium sp.]
MQMRSTAERIRQTLYFELGGIGLVTPLYMAFTGASFSEGAVLLVAISVAVMLWSPLHNTVFDFVDLRLSGRVASDRPQVLRAVHAVSHEVTAVCVSLPLLIWLGGLSLWDAVFADILLTLFYTAYAYVFHVVFDWLRPVGVSPKAEKNEGAA